MKRAAQRFLFAWRHALASEEGPEVALDRLVAMTLALYMDRDGLSAWPNQDTLAARSGLTDRTVGKSLARLCGQGWLERQARKSPKGNRHPRFGFEYRARMPRQLADAYAKGERGSLFNGRDPRLLGVQGNTERDDTGIPNGVRTNTSSELPQLPACRKERVAASQAGAATPAARLVHERRLQRDQFVAAYEAAERLAA